MLLSLWYAFEGRTLLDPGKSFVLLWNMKVITCHSFYPYETEITRVRDLFEGFLIQRTTYPMLGAFASPRTREEDYVQDIGADSNNKRRTVGPSIPLVV